MGNANDKLQREILPIPDILPPGLTTYDARDPDTRRRASLVGRNAREHRRPAAGMAPRRW